MNDGSSAGPSGAAHDISNTVVPLEGCEALLPRQVTTLAFLSEHLPASLISEQLARWLHLETGAKVVLVRFKPQASAAPAELVLNGVFHMPAQIHRTESGFHLLTLQFGSEPPSTAGVASLIRQLSRHFRHILVEAQAGQPPPPWLFDFLLGSEMSYLFVRAATEDVYQLEQVIHEARRRGRVGGIGLKAIACLADGEQINGFDHLAQQISGPMHFFVRGCPMGSNNESVPLSAAGARFGPDVRRLAREVGGRLLGLALSSGAAKGFAHIGVIQVLEENGIEIDVVAGASMGAYVGSLWAQGNDGPELERLAREMEGCRWRLWSLVDPAFPPRQGFLRGFAIKKRLMRTLGHARFADLRRPMRVVAANLETLERVVFSWGEVATAVHASIAVPGICVPVKIDGESYIDGGIVDPLPVGTLREMGVGRVIAVDAIPTPDRIRYGLQAERELARHRESKRRRFFRKVVPLDQQLNYFARGNLFEILMRSVHGAQIRVAEASGRQADLLLRPDICDDRWLDFRNPGKFISLGREVAERHLPEIKALAAGKESHHGERIEPSLAAIV